MRKMIGLLLALGLVAAACGSDDTQTTATTSATTAATEAPSTTATTQAEEMAGPEMSPAELVVDAQTSDGTTINIVSVTLPSAGFVAVHSSVDGAPGPVIGVSDLLTNGTSTDVTITLDEALAATDTVFPMVHIDVDEDGQYTFMPPDNAIDLPATTADGAVAVTAVEIAVEG